MCSNTCMGPLILVKMEGTVRVILGAKSVVLSGFWGGKKRAFERCENISNFSIWMDFSISTSFPISHLLPWCWNSNASSMACCHRSHATMWIAKEKLSYWSSSNLLSKWWCLFQQMRSVNHLTWWISLGRSDNAQSTTADLLHFSCLTLCSWSLLAYQLAYKLSIKVQLWKSSV